MDAQQVIARSISHNETVKISADEATAELCETLSAESDSGPQQGKEGYVQYWGHDQDGNEWTVHVLTE